MRALGAALAASSSAIEAPLTIAIHGELGAGKTTLVGGYLSALGFAGHAKSPTYTLIEPYELTTKQVYHLDLYRLADPREVEALGLRDLQQPNAVFLIEWPDKGAGMLPPIDLDVRIRYASESVREVALESGSVAGDLLARGALAATKP